MRSLKNINFVRKIALTSIKMSKFLTITVLIIIIIIIIITNKRKKKLTELATKIVVN